MSGNGYLRLAAWFSLLAFAACSGMAATSCGQPPSSQQQWGQWRGPFATGSAAATADPPTTWSEREEKNIRWKTAIPGRGHSSPVVWGELIFLTAAVPIGDGFEPIPDNAPGSHDNLSVSHKQRFVVIAVRRTDGKIVWRSNVREAIPHEGAHYTASLASASPITDGKHVFAYFGSHGLYCLDMAGQVVWKKDLGRMQTKHGHGEGASPVLDRDVLVVNWDHEGRSFVLAMDARTGEEKWRRARNEVTSWATPIVVARGQQRQLIVSGTSRVRAYDIESGDILWECGGLSANIVASPVATGGIVYAASSYDTRAVLAIRVEGARGDITGSKQVVWSRRRNTPYVPSPLLYQDSIYYLGHYQGVLSRLNARTGEEPLGPFRLSGIREAYASPVAAAGRIYVVDRGGLTVVVSHGDKPEVLAANRLDDSFNASPAIVGKELFLRGEKWLYCLAEQP